MNDIPIHTGDGVVTMYLTGQVSEVCMHNYPLSAEEIRAIYQGYSFPMCPMCEVDICQEVFSWCKEGF